MHANAIQAASEVDQDNRPSQSLDERRANIGHTGTESMPANMAHRAACPRIILRIAQNDAPKQIRTASSRRLVLT